MGWAGADVRLYKGADDPFSSTARSIALNIRVDDQVERAYQDSAWVLKAYGAVLKAMEQEGHEIRVASALVAMVSPERLLDAGNDR